MGLELTLIALGLLGLVLGSGLGAHFAGVSLWKGLAISFGGGLGQGVISEFVVSSLWPEGKLILDWVIFIVIVGLIAWALRVGPRACAVIVIGGLLGLSLFTVAGGLAFLSFTDFSPVPDAPPLDGGPPYSVPPESPPGGSPSADPVPAPPATTAPDAKPPGTVR